jgi:VCBS repeat-containing protein
MKKTFYCIILGLLVLACDDSDEDYAITDYEGLSLDLSWDEVGVENAKAIGLVLYDPDGVLLYHGQDSAAILNYLPDGQFVCEVFTKGQVDKTDYKIEVQGLNDKTIHTFRNSLSKSDPVGFKKRSLLVTKNKERYTVDIP